MANNDSSFENWLQKRVKRVLTLTMWLHYLNSAIILHQLLQICLENVFDTWPNLTITISGGDFVIFSAYILYSPFFTELCWLDGYKIGTFYPSPLIYQNTARKKGWIPHLEVPFLIEVDKIGCGVTSSPLGSTSVKWHKISGHFSEDLNHDFLILYTLHASILMWVYSKKITLFLFGQISRLKRGLFQAIFCNKQRNSFLTWGRTKLAEFCILHFFQSNAIPEEGGRHFKILCYQFFL